MGSAGEPQYAQTGNEKPRHVYLPYQGSDVNVCMMSVVLLAVIQPDTVSRMAARR